MPEAPVSDVLLGRRRWPEVAGDRGGPLLLVPVGSLEQHGPALPLATDTLVATHVAHEAARRAAVPGASVQVAPAVTYGASGEHEDFPGTVSIGRDALRLLLVELGRSACRWARALVFVNGHGGNATTLVEAVATLRAEGRPVAWSGCVVPGGDAHAGATETSMLLVLAPGLVRADLLAAGEVTPVAELMPRLRAHGVRSVSPSGVLGDPTTASPEEGHRVLDALVSRLVAELSGAEVDDHGRLSVPAATGP